MNASAKTISFHPRLKKGGEYVSPKDPTALWIWGMLAAVLLLFGAAAQAEIFVIKRADGSVTFTSRKPRAGEHARLFVPSKISPKSFLSNSFSSGTARPRLNFNNRTFDTLINNFSRFHDVEPALVKAVIHAESAFNPRAISPKGARGLMQLMPQTAKEVGVKNSFEPRQNIYGGVRYLRKLLTKYRGDIALAIAAYNAGPGAVDNHSGIPPYAETKEYVRRVLALHHTYKTTL
jgi:soluble lytic murein transglycosylase-like protein